MCVCSHNPGVCTPQYSGEALAQMQQPHTKSLVPAFPEAAVELRAVIVIFLLLKTIAIAEGRGRVLNRVLLFQV